MRPFPGGCVCARSDALGAQFFLHLGGHVVDDVADFGRRLAGLLDGQEAELQGRAGCRAQIRRERHRRDRFSKKVAAQLVPLIGAACGAAINLVLVSAVIGRCVFWVIEALA